MIGSGFLDKDENKFIITPKNDKATSLTIRIDLELNDILDNISQKSNRSRNEIINKALEFALDNLEFVNEDYNE